MDFEDKTTIVETTVLSAAPSPASGSSAYFVVIAGAEAGRMYKLDEPEMMIGRAMEAGIRIVDDGVSRRHAKVQRDSESRISVVDLGSTNGTYVNQVRITQALLRGGEQVVVGATNIAVSAARAARPTLPPEQGFGRLVGTSDAMRKLYPLCRRLAAASVPVVIEGETGTGKEVLAESLHEEGPRAAGPFVVFDCTTVAPSLVEAALFGHER
ncbi:MAG: FHA domain-containing protein, partial [Myxococcota bacterium]